jgi:hypothetical protein
MSLRVLHGWLDLPPEARGASVALGGSAFVLEGDKVRTRPAGANVG